MAASAFKSIGPHAQYLLAVSKRLQQMNKIRCCGSFDEPNATEQTLLLGRLMSGCSLGEAHLGFEDPLSA
jgi:hypothetical protein